MMDGRKRKQNETIRNSSSFSSHTSHSSLKLYYRGITRECRPIQVQSSLNMSRRGNADSQPESEPAAKRFANQNENEIKTIAEKEKLQAARIALDRLDYKNSLRICTEVSPRARAHRDRISASVLFP